MNRIQLTAILVLSNMTVSLCYAKEALRVTVPPTHPYVTYNQDVESKTAPQETVNPVSEAPPVAPQETPAPSREYSQKCIAAMGDYEIATVQQTQAKLLMDQAQAKLNEVSFNPITVIAKSNHQTALRANQKIFAQASEDVRKSLIRIANECGQNFDVFLEDVRAKIYEYVDQSLKESNKIN